MNLAIIKTPIAVLISGTGSNLQALIDFQDKAGYQIELVISNRPDALGLVKAKNAGIKTVSLDHKSFPDRSSFDQEMIKTLDQYKIELIVLAGFMRILTAEFTEHFLGKMVNIHPSLLPKYQGLNTHQRVLEANDSEHGLSIHFVTAELDGGPIIQQVSFKVQANDTIESLNTKIKLLEHKYLPSIVDKLAQGEISFANNKVVIKTPSLTPVIINETI
ncbi:MAG TPA: phosphoribosylglycinamide formyltransferase [Thiomicrospira sp.]|nr:phosphoribosylglycinamide formyltransferase [Thiomicrospira sp.]